MKVLSLSVNGDPLDGKFDGRIEGKTIVVRQRKDPYVVLTAFAEHELSIAGGTYHLVGVERKAGTAAAGAIIGGMFAGGAGLLAGGAMGAGTQSLVSIHHGNVILVVEFSNAELAKLASFGVLIGSQAPGVSSVKLGELRVTSSSKLSLGAIVAFVLLIVLAKMG